MHPYNILITAVLLGLCHVANAGFDADQSMLDDLDAGHPPISQLAATERLLAAAGSVLHLPLRQRTRAEIRANTANTGLSQTEQSLRIYRHAEDNGVRFSLGHIEIQQGSRLPLAIEGYQHDEVEIYVRDQGIASLQDDALFAESVGSSEIIFIVAKTLHILPLTVTAHRATPSAVIELPDELADKEKISEPADADSNNKQHDQRFSVEAQSALYGEIELQVVDERSYDSYYYPVDNIDMRIVGADAMELRTDAQGKVRIAGMPLQGRVLVEFSDPLGRYVSGFQEITLEPSQRTYRLVALRTLTDDSMAASSGKVRHARLASMCGELEQSEESFSIETDAPADGVFYFNKLGLLDLRQRNTSAFPRFCILNADPGPMTVFVKDEQGETVGVFNVGLAAGHHSEETFKLWLDTDVELQVRLATRGITSYRHQLLESAELRMLGATDSLSFANAGVISTYPSYHQQRSHVLVEDPNFEQTLHALELQGETSEPSETSAAPVLSLLPRGALAHIALQANVSYDASMGSVQAEIGYEDADDIRLINAYGREFAPTWLEQRTDAITTTFLNLTFGVYQLLVRNSSGHWLAVQTVMVYNEAVSQLRVGNTLRYSNYAPD